MYKYIDAPHPEFYDLRSDAAEKINIYASDSGRAAALRRDLHKLLADHAAKRPVSSPALLPQRTRALLTSLGYLSGERHKPAGTALPDPKDRLGEYKLYESAQTELYDRHLERATAILRRILARDPKNTLARRDLGGAYVEEHQYAKARLCLEQVVTSAPDDYMAQFELGIACKHLGLKKEALVHVEAACSAAPQAQQCRRELEALHAPSASRH